MHGTMIKIINTIFWKYSVCNIKKASEQALDARSVILFSKHHFTKQYHAITATLNTKFHTVVTC